MPYSQILVRGKILIGCKHSSLLFQSVSDKGESLVTLTTGEYVEDHLCLTLLWLGFPQADD